MKMGTNKALHGRQLDIALGNHASHVQPTHQPLIC